MVNNLQLFKFEGKEVRTLEVNGTPWFVGKDLTNILGYKMDQEILILTLMKKIS